MIKTKNKKKGSGGKISTIILFLVFMFIGGFCGFLGIGILDKLALYTNNHSGNLLVFALIIILFYLIIYLQIIVHEGGHLLFGKLSGYQFVSFRIGKWMLISNKGRHTFKKYTIVGTGGQCLMMPPECDGCHYPYILYNLGGCIANILVSLPCLLLYFYFPHSNIFSIFLIFTFIIGIAFALINGLPLQLSGIATDGHNAFSLGKDKDARYAFWLQLYVNGLLTSGMHLHDMPSEWFEIPENFDWSNSLNCSTAVLRFSYLNDKMGIEEATALAKFLLEEAPGTLEIHKNELRCELLFYEITGLCRKDEIEKLYTKKLQNYIKATKSYVSRKRLMYAYELLVNHNDAAAQKEFDAFEKTAKSYPYSGEIENERDLIFHIKENAVYNQG